MPYSGLNSRVKIIGNSGAPYVSQIVEQINSINHRIGNEW